MPRDTLQAPKVLKDLGGGLVIRRATLEDAGELAAFNAGIHKDPGATEPQAGVHAWTSDLISGEHPTFETGDFLVVEDTNTGKIVSSVNLISQIWEYEGISFKVGRPELVGTNPEYRNRGLVRAQFEILHEWSAEREEMVQAITGIYWYYKLFGYTYALELGAGRAGYKPQVPKLKEGEPEPFTFRPAAAADIPFIMALYNGSLQRMLVGCVRDAEMWRYELRGRREKSVVHNKLVIIQTPEGEPVGYVRHSTQVWGQMLGITGLEVTQGTLWTAVMPSVVRYIWSMGEQYAVLDKKEEMSGFALRMGTEHPAYRFFERRLPRTVRPYAWYIRIPQPAAFLKHIAPALERHLYGSLLAGYTGELKISNYRSGTRLVFENGKLTSAEPYKPESPEDGHAFFPELTFIELLFGYRSAEQLKEAYPDCWFATDEAQVLVDILFPRKASYITPVE